MKDSLHHFTIRQYVVLLVFFLFFYIFSYGFWNGERSNVQMNRSKAIQNNGIGNRKREKSKQNIKTIIRMANIKILREFV